MGPGSKTLPASDDLPIWRRLSEALVEYRVPASASIVLVALASVYVLASQSASSWPTYVLGAYVVAAVGKWRALFLDRGFLLVVAVVAYIPLTSLWSTPWDGRDMFSQVTRALLVLTFVVCIAESVLVDWFRRRLTQALAIFGALGAAAAVVVFFADPPLDGRLNGLGQLDAHVTASMVFAVAAVGGLAWLTDARRIGARWLAGACVAVLVIAIVLAGSRNAMVCAALGIGCGLIASRVAAPARFCLVAGALAAVLGVALLAAYSLIPGAADMVLPRGDSFRPAIWTDYAARIVDDGLWFGLGVSTPDLIRVGGYDVLHPHNLYLAVTYQGGLVALALLLAVIVTTIRTLLVNYAQSDAKFALAIWAVALPGYLLDGHELIDKIGWTWLLFWLPVGIAVGIRARLALEDARRFGVRLV